MLIPKAGNHIVRFVSTPLALWSCMEGPIVYCRDALPRSPFIGSGRSAVSDPEPDPYTNK